MLLTMVSLTHIYLYRRFVSDVWEDGRARIFGKRVIICLALTILVGIPLSRALGGVSGKTLAYVAFTYFGLLGVLLPLLISLDLARAGYLLFTRRRAEVDEDRRKFLARGMAMATAVGATATGAVGVAEAASDPQLRSVEVPIKGLPADLEGLTIAQLSDVHIGAILRKDFLMPVVQRVNALKPDLVVVTGDLVDGSVANLGEHVAPLADLKSTFGTYFVTGNHEYYSGADAWIAFLKEQGLVVLDNRRVEITRGSTPFDLIGVHDWRAKGFGHKYDFEAAVKDRDKDKVSILLSHQPKAIHDAAKEGIDLVLSGHTHGGQIWPFNFAVQLVQPYVAGLHAHTDKTWIYVHTGTGFWGPPVRVGTQSEIALLTLRTA